MPGLLVNNGRVWNDGVDSLLGDKYKNWGVAYWPEPAHTHKSLRLKALVTALLELIAHTHDDDDANDESEDEKDKIMMIIEDLPFLWNVHFNAGDSEPGVCITKLFLARCQSDANSEKKHTGELSLDEKQTMMMTRRGEGA